MISEQAAHHIHPGLSRKLIWLLSSLWVRLIKIQCQRLQLEHRDTSNKTSVTSPSELFVNIFYYKKLSTLSDLGLIQQICYLFKLVENLPLFKIFVGSFSIFIPTYSIAAFKTSYLLYRTVYCKKRKRYFHIYTFTCTALFQSARPKQRAHSLGQSNQEAHETGQLKELSHQSGNQT